MYTEEEKQLYYTIRQFQKLKQRIKPIEITHGECWMLVTVEALMKEHKEENCPVLGVKISDLSKKLKASKSATSQMLRGLEEKKYVKRIPDAADKRIVYIELTTEGNMILENVRMNRSKLLNQVFDEMGEQDVKEFFRIINKFYRVLEKQIDTLN